MKIGIDISQIVYEGTGVGNYVLHLVDELTKLDKNNQYVLFGSSLRKSIQYKVLSSKYKNRKNVIFKIFKFPPTLFDLLWNKLHICPIEYFIGDVDVFISSDWTQPPTRKAKRVTVLYDLIVYKYPEETHNKFQFSLKNLLIKPNIVASQKRRLHWVKKECDQILCISEATKQDAIEILGINEKRLKVTYPGV